MQLMLLYDEEQEGETKQIDNLRKVTWNFDKF